MTREEVVEILGPYIPFREPVPLDPDCDSFIYSGLVDAKFTHVWYVNRRVVEVTTGHDALCGIE